MVSYKIHFLGKDFPKLVQNALTNKSKNESNYSLRAIPTMISFLTFTSDIYIWHVYLIKYDADGNLEWQTTYSPADGGDWAGEDIDLAADGTPIIAVDNGQFGFLKLDSF